MSIEQFTARISSHHPSEEIRACLALRRGGTALFTSEEEESAGWEPWIKDD